MNTSEKTDLIDLFDKISKGDNQAFTTVYQQYCSKIYSTVLQYCKLKDLAEDVTQQVFFILWGKKRDPA